MTEPALLGRLLKGMEKTLSVFSVRSLKPKAHLKLRRFKSLWLGRKQQERNDVGLKKRPLRLARQLRLLFGGGGECGLFLHKHVFALGTLPPPLYCRLKACHS